MFKKNFLFFLMVINFFLCSAAIIMMTAPSLLTIFIPEAYLPIFTARANLYAVIIVSILMITVCGFSYRVTKERCDFDEFGSRKKNAKLHLSSDKREMVEAKQLAENERILPAAALAKVIKKGSTSPMEDLDRLIGMASVKDEVKELKARMEFDENSRSKKGSSEMHHMVFYGPPGTGKTTVARIMTGLFYDYGYIEKNKLLEVDGNFLKSMGASDTEKKVRMILSKAYGGVLFVDEAYALTQSGDAAGKQAIATLIKEMEDNRDKLIVIFAGYSNEMRQMLDTNPGFRSRIKDYIEFPDYDNDDLFAIAKSMFKEKGFSLLGDSSDNFIKRIDNEKLSPAWGNARTVRNIVEESIDNHAINYQQGLIPKSSKYDIIPQDIKAQHKKTI